MRIVLAVVLGMLLSGVVQARQGDSSMPVSVDAEHSDTLAKPNGTAHLKGDVVITQGTLKVTSDAATAYFDSQTQVKRVVLAGHAHIQQQDDQGRLMTGQADTIDYDMASSVAILTGHVHLKTGDGSTLSGDKVVYNTGTGQMSALGTADKRVHMVFKARPKSAPVPAPGTAAAPGSAATAASSAPVPATAQPAAATSAPRAPAQGN